MVNRGGRRGQEGCKSWSVCRKMRACMKEQTDARMIGNSSESDGERGKELRDVALSCPGSQRSMPSHLSAL